MSLTPQCSPFALGTVTAGNGSDGGDVQGNAVRYRTGSETVDRRLRIISVRSEMKRLTSGLLKSEEPRSQYQDTYYIRYQEECFLT